MNFRQEGQGPDTSGMDLISRDNMGIIPNDLKVAIKSAEEFMNYYNWVTSIELVYLSFALKDILYIFLFEIQVPSDDIENWVSVFQGDVPSAYLPGSAAINSFEALDGYLGALEEWIKAAKSGASVANLIPVDVPANSHNAMQLQKRVDFIDQKILKTLK